VKIYAHRGASATHAENTLAAFREALRLGVDGIEFDVQASSDQSPVVIHDLDLVRTTGCSGLASEFTAEELGRFDAGNGESIPTLNQVLDLVGDRAHVDVEIKARGIERQVLGALSTRRQVRWAISSFDWSILAKVRQLSDGAELWLVTEGFLPDMVFRAKSLGVSTFSLGAASYTEETAALFGRNGFNAVIWTVNDLDEARRVQQLGATAICTDDPARLMFALRGAQ
jgi:glycerophosphoryl diester phosphodiesterase